MDLALMILLPLPIGFFVRNRLAAYGVYLAAFSFLFTFQSTFLVIKWVNGAKNAFGGYPKANTADVWSYGVVNLIIAGVGIGLLAFGAWLGSKRRAARTPRVEAVSSAGVRVSS